MDGWLRGRCSRLTPCGRCARWQLVESLIDGLPFHVWADKAAPPAEVRERICTEGVDAVIKMIFLDNFVHGDLHP